MTRKVVIDTDPGIDDSIALLLALHSPELEVVGITISGGNIDLDKGASNAMKIVALCGKDIPVFKGEAKPLRYTIELSDECHGTDGMGNIHLPESGRVVEKQSAVDFLIQMGETHRGDISLLALAPLTNIAVAIERNPGAMEGYCEIISMGGGIGIGNMNPVAEFNYWVDPDAAQIVYDFSIPVTMVGLNVTSQVVFTPTDFAFMDKAGGWVGDLLNRMQVHYVDYYWRSENILGCVAHDVLAVAVAIDRSIVQTLHCRVDIATAGITRGECVADTIDAWKKRKNCHAALDVDKEKFRDLFFDRLFPHGRKQYETYKQFRNPLKN